jgi:hypothetical protein
MEPDVKTLEALAPVKVWQEFLDNEKFQDDRERLFPSKLEIGTREDVLVVTGENASGKSLAFLILNNLVRSFGKEDKIDVLVMDIGMSRRTKSGIERAFIFGDEHLDSTGNISIKVMQTGVANSRSNDQHHYLMLDEPDIGVGEGYHSAIGQFLSDFAASLPEKCLGLIVATHSRKITRKLLDAGASSLRLGSDLRDVKEWVTHGDIEKSLDDLVALKTISLERFRGVSKMLNGKK